MPRVIELRKVIKNYLISKHPRVYFERAPDDAAYPYLVFDLPNSLNDGTMENFVLDIDGWDAPANKDTTELETLMGSVNAGLNREVFRGGGFAFVFYLENRLTVQDDDKRIRRRKYIYQARTFGGE